MNESTAAVSSEAFILKAAPGAFVYKMYVHQPGCPTSGNSCDKQVKKSIPAGVLAEFDSAIALGGPGLQAFFTTGSWDKLFPGLDTSNPTAYARFASGDYEARPVVIQSTENYLFGRVGFTNDHAEYQLALLD